MDTEDGDIKLISSVIQGLLDIEVSVLMGANIAQDVAREDFCEATVGCRSPEQGGVFKKLFQTPSFRINVVSDVAAVELCGALKVRVRVWMWVWVWVWLGGVGVVGYCLFVCLFQNIVAVSAGFSDGLE